PPHLPDIHSFPTRRSSDLLDQVQESDLLTILARPYTKFPAADGGYDLNLRLERWDHAAAQLSLGDWSELCSRARQTAERIVRDADRKSTRLNSSHVKISYA